MHQVTRHTSSKNCGRLRIRSDFVSRFSYRRVGRYQEQPLEPWAPPPSLNRVQVDIFEATVNGLTELCELEGKSIAKHPVHDDVRA